MSHSKCSVNISCSFVPIQRGCAGTHPGAPLLSQHPALSATEVLDSTQPAHQPCRSSPPLPPLPSPPAPPLPLPPLPCSETAHYQKATQGLPGPHSPLSSLLPSGWTSSPTVRWPCLGMAASTVCPEPQDLLLGAQGLVGVSRALRSVWKLQVRGMGQGLGSRCLQKWALGALPVDSAALAALHPHLETALEPRHRRPENSRENLVQGLWDEQGMGRRTAPCTQPSRDVTEGAQMSQPIAPAPLPEEAPPALGVHSPMVPLVQKSGTQCTRVCTDPLTHGFSLRQGGDDEIASVP